MIPRFLISLKTFFYKNFQSAVFKPLANDKTGLITCQNISLMSSNNLAATNK